MSENILNNQIKDQLYSRQIASIGIESMKKISELKILVIGMKGIGVEICKNIILQGPSKVSIFDCSIAEKNDFDSNYFLSKEDVGNKRRDEAVYNKLKELNEYVDFDCLLNINSIEEIENIINEYNVIVVTEIIKKEYLFRLNKKCHEKNIKFILCAILGLVGYIFSDFGNEHLIINKNDKEPNVFSIKNITNDTNGLVEIIETNEGINNIKSVIFQEIEGMTELNNKEPIKIKIKDKYSFYIGDTTKYNKYEKGGIVKEKEIPIKISYKELEERFTSPYNNNEMILNFTSDNEDKISSEQLYLVFIEIVNYFEKNENSLLYLSKNIENYEIIIDNIKKYINNHQNESWIKKINNLDEKIIKNICLNCNKEISCLTSFLGGIVSQEIIKSIGKYFPINQWAIFDFSDNYKNNVNLDNKINSRYKNLYDILGYENILNLQNKKILLIGTGALGCELLKNFGLLGIKDVTAVDNDFIELSNLNRQFLFREKDLGKSKVEVACNIIKEINPELEKYQCFSKKIEKETENIFDENFWLKFDVIFCALDSLDGRKYIDEKCIFYEKPWINGGMNGCKGKTEVFIPFKTCCLRDINYGSKIKNNNNENSCTLRYFPSKIEDCILWSKNLFFLYFINYIIDLEKILNNEYNLEKINKDIDNNDENELLKINILYEYLSIYYTKNIIDLIKLAYNIFYLNFITKIKETIKLYPIDLKNEDGTLFWKNKRIPHPLDIHKYIQLYNQFIFYYIKILGKILNIDVGNIDTSLFAYSNYENILNNDKKIIFNKIIELKKLIKNIEINKIEFEKDSINNGHIDFIHYCANLRAINYNIPSCNRYKTFKVAGNIAPSTITINSILSGLMSFELISLIFNKDKIRKYTIDLDVESGIYLEEEISDLYFKENYYDKFLECNFEVIPNKFTSWDKIEIKGSRTLSEFLLYIKDNFNVDVTLLNANEIIIFEKKILRNLDILLSKKKGKKIENDNINMKIEDIYKQKKNSNNIEKTIYINISGNKGDSRVLMPIIKYIYY